MRTRTVIVSILVLIAALTPRAQQTPPRPGEQPPVTFKVEVNYVEIDAVVTDQQGNFVRNLTKDDFQVFEQGKPQQVSVFSLVDIPVEKFDPPLYKTSPVEPDVRSNRKEFDGRVFVLVLDDLNTHFARSGRVKAAARQFIERYLGANDVAAVVQTGGTKASGQEFTSSRERLLRAVGTFMGQKERSATLEKIDDYNRLRSMGSSDLPRDPIEALRVHKARNTFIVLKNVSDYMAGIRGRRKAVVLFSEGVDYDVYDQITNRYASDIQGYGKDAIAAATRANVNIYAVDPRGLGGFDDTGELATVPDDVSLGLGIGSMQREMRIAQDSLRTIADETGGFAAINSNDFSSSFGRIIQDNSSYYVLGYYSSDARRDGDRRLHRDARGAEQPGARHRARHHRLRRSPGRRRRHEEGLRPRRRRSRGQRAEVQGGGRAFCKRHRSGNRGDGRGREGARRREGRRATEAASRNARGRPEKRRAHDAAARSAPGPLSAAHRRA
jgi:VWFA-related protein